MLLLLRMGLLRLLLVILPHLLLRVLVAAAVGGVRILLGGDVALSGHMSKACSCSACWPAYCRSAASASIFLSVRVSQRPGCD